MKVIALIVVLLSFAIHAQAVSLNVSTAIPTDKEFREFSSVGFSGGLAFHLPIYGFSGVLSASYGLWSEKSLQDAEIDFTNFPVIMAGGRKYFGNLYGSFMAGIYPVKTEVTKKGEKSEEKETQGALCPGVGYAFPVSSFFIDVSANYLWTQDFSQAFISAGLLFPM